MSNPILETIEGIEKRVGAFRDAMNPEAAAEKIGQAVNKVRGQFSGDALGIAVDLAPADVVKKYESAARQAYDKTLRETAAALSSELQATERALNQTIAVASSLPHPLDATEQGAVSDNTRAVDRLRATIEVDRAERRLAGKTLAQVIDMYAGTKDSRDGALVWYIESQYAAGWRDVNLVSTPDDAAAVMNLKRLIGERQKARVEANHPELAQARERLSKLRTATLDSQFRHLLQGRGLAAVP